VYGSRDETHNAASVLKALLDDVAAGEPEAP
jgi:uncharacterized protein YeaO (DUF488 family)